MTDSNHVSLINDQAYPEVMREIADVVARSLVESGVQRERALALGEAAAEAVRERHGGTLMYLPKGYTMKTQRRWQALWEDFTGDNHAALAIKHDMNVKGVYRVLAVMRAQHHKRTQQDLFEQAR
jgi:Mor family transcriptional regulator